MRNRLVAIICALILILCGAVWYLRFFPLAKTVQVRPLYMSALRIFAYQWSLPKSRFWWIPSDDLEHPRKSSLALFEDGRELGPAHSQHNDIATKGRGRFSHWAGMLIFSSSDLTEPRYNKKKYAVRIKPLPRNWLLFTSLVMGGGIILGIVSTRRRKRSPKARARP